MIRRLIHKLFAYFSFFFFVEPWDELRLPRSHFVAKWPMMPVQNERLSNKLTCFFHIFSAGYRRLFRSPSLWEQCNFQHKHTLSRNSIVWALYWIRGINQPMIGVFLEKKGLFVFLFPNTVKVVIFLCLFSSQTSHCKEIAFQAFQWNWNNKAPNIGSLLTSFSFLQYKCTKFLKRIATVFKSTKETSFPFKVTKIDK